MQSLGQLQNRYGNNLWAGIIGTPPEGIGKPLGNHASSKLSGFYKIKLKNLGYWVVYDLVHEGSVMKIIIISVRDDEAVYKEAERRIQDLVKPME